jgi:hypothetical protein
MRIQTQNNNPVASFFLSFSLFGLNGDVGSAAVAVVRVIT